MPIVTNRWLPWNTWSLFGFDKSSLCNKRIETQVTFKCILIRIQVHTPQFGFGVKLNLFWTTYGTYIVTALVFNPSTVFVQEKWWRRITTATLNDSISLGYKEHGPLLAIQNIVPSTILLNIRPVLDSTDFCIHAGWASQNSPSTSSDNIQAFLNAFGESLVPYRQFVEIIHLFYNIDHQTNSVICGDRSPTRDMSNCYTLLSVSSWPCFATTTG